MGRQTCGNTVQYLQLLTEWMEGDTKKNEQQEGTAQNGCILCKMMPCMSETALSGGPISG